MKNLITIISNHLEYRLSLFLSTPIDGQPIFELTQASSKEVLGYSSNRSTVSLNDKQEQRMFLFSLPNKGLKKAVTQGIPVRHVVMSEVTQYLVYSLNELVKASVSSLQSAVVAHCTLSPSQDKTIF